MRNTLNKVRFKDSKKLAKDLKKIYHSSPEKEALKVFERFKERWVAV